ncbi:signal sequence receptor beta [Dermatophagoides farinae]|uniref:Translocon-associated protein subunit beta n=2 Tax=Dermatophagoides farinae TaxID=6954 RepID=A0A922L2R1_DERFA|nr:translocon-associated protein subunit beta-like [Dermatophagoides farinae]KAH9506321.1 SWI/SNF and RSC complex subunit Ssr2 [Dermatophagoides farinae]
MLTMTRNIPFILFVLISWTLMVSTDEQNSDRARLLAEKQVLNKYLVENKDILINYNIFNVGSSSAINVKLSDNTFSLAHFDIVGGSLKFTIPRIAPQSNTTHTVVVRPKEGIWGRFNFTAGELIYSSEGSNELQYGYTSEPGDGYIVSLKEFDKRFSPHYYDWAAFLIISMATVLLPYLLWNGSKNKYEKLSARKTK